jgi:flagellar biosynthesis/type III secretory pathway protein FliH
MDELIYPPNFMSALDVLIERGERAAREEGISIGEAKGKAEGKAKGKVEGKAEGEANAIRRVIEKAIKHGKLTDEEIADYNDTTVVYVQQVRTDMQKPPKS